MRKDTRTIRPGPDHLLIRSGAFAEAVAEMTERVTGEPVRVEPLGGGAFRLYRETPEGKEVRA